MWLLSTARAELEFFSNPEDVPKPGFCILSHTWGDDEQTFHDLQRFRSECAKTGDNPRNVVSEKIRSCCEVAEKDGYAWVWIDTCCINKESSAELSEAINSMFRYYSLSGLCYAYLSDVHPPADAELTPEIAFDDSKFKESRWHTRGWTLQELIAPEVVLFFSSTWTFLGSKADLACSLQEATHLPTSLLCGDAELFSFSVAQRMSWAANRKTSRREDEAYCLLGIFAINMPTLYGEGGNAFYRLQEEIIRRSADTTIFAWRLDVLELDKSIPTSLGPAWLRIRSPLLAQSPRDFCISQNIRLRPLKRNWRQRGLWTRTSNNKAAVHNTFTLTPHGFLAQVRVATFGKFTLIDLGWETDVETQPYNIYLVVTTSAYEKVDSLMYVFGSQPAQETAHRLALYVSTSVRLRWKSRQLYISSHRGPDVTSISPRPQEDLFPRSVSSPWNRSYQAPFHFRLEVTQPNFFVESLPDVDVYWTGSTPGGMKLSYKWPSGRTELFRMTFGVCTASNPANLTESRPQGVHWLRVQSRPPLDQPNGVSHSCLKDHLEPAPGRKICYRQLRSFNGLTGEIGALVYSLRVELAYAQNPWSEDTIVFNNIECHEAMFLKNPSSRGAFHAKSNLTLLHTDDPFPVNIAGPPLTTQKEGPSYLGSAVRCCGQGEVITPCRIVLRSAIPTVFLSGKHSGEVPQLHEGYYYLLTFDNERMYWAAPEECERPEVKRRLVTGGWDDSYRNHSHYACTFGDNGKNIEEIGYVPRIGMGWQFFAWVQHNGTTREVRNHRILCWK